MGKKTTRIEICGGIGSGKTSMAMMLQDNGITGVFENFEANPFLQPFYEDPISHAFETEVTFLAQHYHQVKVAEKSIGLFVSDFSILQDLAFARVNLKDSKLGAFFALWEEVQRSIIPPVAVIHLRCHPDVQLKRIQMRERIIERSISVNYLDAINVSIEKEVSALDDEVAVVTIQSDKDDFVSNEKVKYSILFEIKDIIGVE